MSKDFLQELKAEFLQTLEDENVRLNQLAMDYEVHRRADAITEILRMLHSQKGSAHAVHFVETAKLIHQLESDISSIKAESKVELNTFVSNILKMLDQILETAKQELSVAS